jgi:hypothetical protein
MPFCYTGRMVKKEGALVVQTVRRPKSIGLSFIQVHHRKATGQNRWGRCMGKLNCIIQKGSHLACTWAHYGGSFLLSYCMHCCFPIKCFGCTYLYFMHLGGLKKSDHGERRVPCVADTAWWLVVLGPAKFGSLLQLVSPTNPLANSFWFALWVSICNGRSNTGCGPIRFSIGGSSMFMMSIFI